MSRKSVILRTIALLLSVVFVLGVAPAAYAYNTQQKEYITNIALGKAATASSYESAARAPSAGNDGVISSLWVANNGAPGNWWMVDLGDTYEILGNEIVFEFDGDVWQYIVEVSLDATTWTTVVDKSESQIDTAVQSDLYNTSARYVKVTITGVPNNRWTAIAEFRVWGMETLVIDDDNVALNKTATASSQENDSRSAAHAVDGDMDTLWIANSGAAGNWLEIDLGGRYDINAMCLTFEDANHVWKYCVETSLNKEDWLMVIDNSTNSFAAKSHAAPVDVTAQYIRVTFAEAPGSLWTALGEIEVFGVENTNTKPSENILVLIPHEDDEAAIAAGIIHQGILNGDSVKVAIVTNGDCNGYNQELGIRRINESITAMGILGLSRNNITVFGYSDTGGFEPWTRYTDSFVYKLYHAADDEILSSNFGNTETYGVAGILDDYHYQVTGQHASYTRENFVFDLTSYIEDFMPDRVYTTSLYDRHGDHAYVNVFLTEILMGLTEKYPGYAPVLYEMIVHSTDADVAWPIVDYDPTPMQEFTPPENIDEIPLEWADRVSVPLPEDMLSIPRSTNMKNRCLMAYTSQYSDYIGSFAKADEFFWVRDFSNLAYKAEVTASDSLAGADASKIADGIIGGYLELPDSDWITDSAAGAWVQLAWESEQDIRSVVLHGSMNSDYAITGGTLEFSDGSSIPVSELPAYGKPLKLDVNLLGITWVRFVVDGAYGECGALSEVEIY